MAWADGGALEGDPKELPAPVSFVEGWRIGKPDVEFEMPRDIPVPAKGTIEYTYVVVPTGFKHEGAHAHQVGNVGDGDTLSGLLMMQSGGELQGKVESPRQEGNVWLHAGDCNGRRSLEAMAITISYNFARFPYPPGWAINCAFHSG